MRSVRTACLAEIQEIGSPFRTAVLTSEPGGKDGVSFCHVLVQELDDGLECLLNGTIPQPVSCGIEHVSFSGQNQKRVLTAQSLA